MNGSRITIVGASAGSGKTYHLTREITNALSGANRIDVTSLVAVTFTRKAHAELEARIRQKLIADDAFDEALRLPLSYVGTIHGVALRLLQELALEAGLSPNVHVVAGNETKLLREAFEQSLDAGTRERLDELAARLELGIRAHRTDWVGPCADIMDLARANRIPPTALPDMASRSTEGLLALLPPAVGDGDALDRALASELAHARASLETHGDDTAKTAEAQDIVSMSIEKLADGELRWSGWAKLSTIAPSKKCADHVAALRLAAGRYEEHPRFHDDIRSLTHGIFDAARSGLIAYRAWKQERRVIDYVDMLDGALSLLDEPAVRDELAARLRFVVVDEFQDTSPIQLALFLRFHELAQRSVWVGDRKQCIFEYAGADPALMDSVADWVTRAGGVRERLDANHRSRPELVRCCSELFAAALEPHGFSREEVVVEARRTTPDELARLPPLGVWLLEGTNKDGDAQAIAEGVKRLLDDPHRTPVVDRATGAVRPVRPADIAVLAATNEWAGTLAVALHACGVRVSIARTGLFDTPEGTLVDSALRWIIDAHDELAAANVDALTGWREGNGDAWLEQRIRDLATDDVPSVSTNWRVSLEAVRARVAILSPGEAVDLTLEALDVARMCARWPDPSQRVANLDALRALAMSYEARCQQERQAATLGGLIRYFDDTRLPTVQRDEMLPSDDQHVPADEGAVVICTYHKSKGLEWPVVILANLDRGTRRDVFEVAPQSLLESFDPEQPLAGRSIRYWPWPLGALEKAPLAERAAQSPEGRAVSLRETRERARLLYVGFTRARDHLALAVRTNNKGKASCGWLDALSSANAPLVQLPLDAADDSIVRARVGVEVDARAWRLRPGQQHDRVDPPTPTWFDRVAHAGAPSAYRITPSSEMSGWDALVERVSRARIGTVERISSGIKLTSRPDSYEMLGQSIHGFLAADTHDSTNDVRHGRARRLVDGWGVASALESAALIDAGDALRTWAQRRWPGAIWHRELPIEGPVATGAGNRWLSGIIDLLLETPDGYVLIDHKSFPAAGESAWRAKCRTFIPQLVAYAAVLDAAGGKTVTECWIHLPVAGGAVNIELRSSGP